MDHILSRLTGQGLAIFPAHASKVPATPHGFRDAVKAANEAHRLFARYPAPLIGIATGSVSGVDVLDVDQRPQAREWFAGHRHRIPRTRTHRTRSGGLHFLFRHAEGLRCSAGRICIGIDVKADDGCCIWWPAAGCAVLCDAPSAPWPDWLLAQARPPALPPMRPVSVVADGKLIQGVLAVVAQAVEGERNHTLYWAAHRLAESTLSCDDAFTLLMKAATRIGLPASEAKGTIKSAFLGRAKGA